MAKDNPDMSQPVVDPEYVTGVFQELEGMEVELDPDPLEFGPARMSGKIKKCRDYLTRIERIALEASRKLHKLKEVHRAAERLYQIDEDKLLGSDAEVRAGRSIDDRRAVARQKLPSQVQELTWLEQGIEDMNTVMSMLKWKQTGLKNAQGQLREQRNLCNEDIGLGRTWGRKIAPGAPTRSGPAVDNAINEQAAIIEDLEEDSEGDEENGEDGGIPGSADSDGSLEFIPGESDEEGETGGDELSDILSESAEAAESAVESPDPKEKEKPPESHGNPAEDSTADGEDVLAFLDSGDDEEKSSESKAEDPDLDSLLDGLD